jgi:ABC-type transport system involved in multi-copper enzyme maturation permease subunit
MIWKIARKDFLLNLLSARFAIGFLLCLFLIPFTLTVNIEDYDNQMRIYQVDQANAESSFKNVRVYSQLRPEIVKPPEPLSIFCRGISGNVGNRVKIWLGEKPLFATGNAAIRDNPLLNSFFSIDFVTIIAVIMSLLALIFTYDACTSEKEDGTLKLQLANSLSRYKILLGKVAGVYLTLLPILVFCYILSAISILNSPNIPFSLSDWGRIILLLLASLLYFTVFVFIGLLVSARLKSSITSVIVCLFFWVFFVFIIPNMAVYLAEGLKKVQSYDNLQYALQDLDEGYGKKCHEYSQTLEQPKWGAYWNYIGGRDGSLLIGGTSKSQMERHRRLHEYTEPLRIDYANKKWAIQKTYLDSLDEQRNLAETISVVSPSEVFRLICASLCRTGADNHHRFMEGTRRYRNEFIDFYRDNKILSSFIYFTPVPPEEFLTADEIMRHDNKEDLPGRNYKEYGYLDVSDMPVFQWKTPNVLTDVKDGLSKLAALIIISIMLFYLSFLSFIRYDVR